MQNNALLYGIGALVVVALGAGAWMYMGGTPRENTNEERAQEDGTQTEGQPQTQRTALTSLRNSQSPQRCTFSTVADTTRTTGTVYVAEGKMRGEFTTTMDDQTIESYMIVEGNTSYVWSDAMPQGVKMSFDAMAAQSEGGVAQGVDPNAAVDYSCSPWVVQASMFALPSGIVFQDMSAFMPR